MMEMNTALKGTFGSYNDEKHKHSVGSGKQVGKSCCEIQMRRQIKLRVNWDHIITSPKGCMIILMIVNI